MRYREQTTVATVVMHKDGCELTRLAGGSKTLSSKFWRAASKLVMSCGPMRVRLKSTIAIFLCVALLGACAERVILPSSYSQQVGGGHQRVTEQRVSKKKLLASLKQGEGANEVRLVTVFRRDRQQLPQYRIFDIRSGSAYHLLGLEDGDILLAANDHIIFDPAGFRTFVIDYLKDQSEASLTISRGGVATLYRYSFDE